MRKILSVFLIISLFILLITGCGSLNGKQDSEGQGKEAKQNAFELPKENVTIDISSIINDGYLPQAIQPAVGGYIAVFATAHKEGGALDNANCRVYSCNVSTGELSKKYAQGTNLEPFVYSNPYYLDGSVSALEMGETQNILFVDLKSMGETRIPVPEGIEIRNISISPDKTKIAYTVDAGTYLCDMDFSNAQRVLPRFDGADPNGMDDRLDKVSGWSLDGQYLMYSKVGYEWTLGHGVLTPSNSGDSFFALPDTGAVLYNGGILVYSEYERVPMGIVNLKEPSKGLVAFGDAFVKEPLSDIAITPDGKYIGEVKNQGDENLFKIVDASTGASVSQYANTIYADQIDFLPDAYAAVLLSKINADSKTAQIFVWNFLKE